MDNAAKNEFLAELASDSQDVLFLLKEATDTIQYYRRLLERFELDSLTGLPGANKYHDFVKELKNRAKTVGIVFYDVNDLKYYNDNKGHAAGDALLQKAAESMIMVSGGNVHSFRLGGDEFVTIITNCTQADIDALMIRWREGLAKLNEAKDGITCSISAGTAFGEQGYAPDEVLKLADERMYANKVEMKAARGQIPR
ncbi:MAG: GGDEF domain-containing protein [Oscillospiraceae bacterium]|nr:GGDEF domain-containing protein [Oscillospiraceae bacterium]